MEDTDALLDMSLDALIASKAKSAKTRSQGTSPVTGGGGRGGRGGGGGKIRASGRAVRKQQIQPYVREISSRQSAGGFNNRVYVGNLAWGVTWKELKDCMALAGRVVKADVGTEASGRSKVRDMYSSKKGE